MRRIALVLAVLLLLSSLAGCAQSQISQEDYDALQVQYDALREEHDQTVQDLQAAEKAAQEAEDQLAAAEETIAALQAAAQETEAEEPGETAEPAGTEEEAETASEEGETIDVSETEIRGGTNQADAVQLPMNTKVYGTLHDAQNMYLSFHTGPDAGSTYQVTVVDKTPIDARIGFNIRDELGTELASQPAYGDGIATTLIADSLSPDTDYYIRLIVQNHSNSSPRNDTVRFALTIRDTNTQAEGIDTTSDLINAIVPSDDIESLTVGTNQDDAALIPFDKTVSGELKDALGGWFAFATTDNTDSSYLISVVNKSIDDSLRIGIYVFDELGTEIGAEYAYSDGITKTFSLDNLLPNTVYYIRLIVQNHGNSSPRNDTVGYDLTVRCQNNTVESNTATVDNAVEMAFKTPFELTATQVRFVANKAVFINEAEAKEALAPVAEIILAHPDHPVLLAGTTATYGAQDGCVRLSNQRADAVKDLLVREFGVPEEQLLTVGLGYEADPFTRGRDRDANGNFVETEGVKNRRVVVLDAEDPVAQKILGN